MSGQLTIYENTPVQIAEGDLLYTTRGKVRAEHIVFACHYPFVNVPGLYFARMHQTRSYVLALEHVLRLDGMFIGIWLYCRNMKVSGWVVLDNMGICSGITATFIRLGNLMNSEIIGKVTDVPWAFIFVREDQYPRHPGQLYEALAYFCFFLIILFIYKKRGPKSVGTGFYFGLCLTLIFTFRFFIEYTKEIQVAFEAGLPMDMGQILSIPLIIAGVWSIASSTKRAKEKNVEAK